MIDYWNIIGLSFLISLVCNGVRVSMLEGMIFHKFFVWILDKFSPNEQLLKPFISCAYCMPSVWGSFICWQLNTGWFVWFCSVVSAIAISGTIYSGLVKKIIDKA